MIPIALFTYARPDYLQQALSSLSREKPPMIYAFCDAPRSPKDEDAVEEVRRIIHQVDFCQVKIVERPCNFGLSQNMIDGIGTVLKKHDAVIVFEEDVICSQGGYQYLCEAAEAYENSTEVTAVTGWTHPLITPGNLNDMPYFDGRGEGSWNFCLWSRSWEGIEKTAIELYKECQAQGIDVYQYGADLATMALNSRVKDIWAVRLVLLHFLKHGVCMRPPWSLIDHIGVDQRGTNVKNVSQFDLQGLKQCPPIPEQWPEPVEHPECSNLWQQACGSRKTQVEQMVSCVRTIASNLLKPFQHTNS